MAELKHTFTSGRMNKDLDDRLVPNGEYTDALNVQVSSSEGSDVGAIENLLGNERLSDLNLQNAITIGSIAYNLKNKIYWFVTSDEKDVILEYDDITKDILPILQDKKGTEIINLDTVVLSSNIDNELIIENFIDSDIITAFDLNIMPALVDEETITNNNVDLTCSDPSILISIPKGTILKRNENSKLVFKNIEYNYSTYGNIKVTATYTSQGVLNFSKNNKITGINIIDDILFWTDNLNQPRKIYIPKFKRTSINFPNEDTKIEYEIKNQSTQITQKLNRPFNEDDISVIKKSPINAPDIKIFDSVAGGIITIQKSLNLFDKIIGDIIKIESLPQNPIWQTGDFVEITSEDTDIILQANVKSISDDPALNSLIELSVVTIENDTTNDSFTFDITLKQKKALYELNFARFAYRWKYKDGEYSCISPFSIPAFISNDFQYDGKEAFNHGMINKLQKIILFDFDILGDDVAEIDILFKETRNNNIYVYETKKRLEFESPELPQDPSTIIIEKEKIHSIVPNDQLLRAWDNVPRKAKSQEVTANRLIYGNYIQNYDVYTEPVFNIGLNQRTNGLKRTIKSDRNYQFGVVYMDEYMRQSPVLSGKNSSKKIDKSNAVVENKFTLCLKNEPPAWARYFKYYIKDNSSEYYNIAVDRFYQDIENGFTYISVPSSDRNKVTNENYLLLKKKHGANEPVLSEDNRYKIIDIFNDPPEFITNRKKEVASLGDIVFTDDYSGSGGGAEVLQKDQAGARGAAPAEDYNQIQIKGANGGQNNAGIWDGVPLDDAKELKPGRFIRFTFADRESDIYEIKSIQQHPAGSNEIKLTVTEPFGEDVNIVWQKASPNYLGTTSGDKANASGIGITILEEFSAAGDKEFDGRFFIKLKTNATLTDSIVTQSIGGVSYLAKEAIMLNGIYPRKYDSYRNDNNYNNSARYKNSAKTDPPNHFVVSDGGSTGNGSTPQNGKYQKIGSLEYNITLEQSTHRNDGAFDQITRQIKIGDFIRFKNQDGTDHHSAVYEIGAIRYHDKKNQKQGGTKKRTIKCISIRFIDEDGEFKPLEKRVCTRDQNTTDNEPIMEVLQKLDNEKIIIKEPAIFETEPLQSKTDLDIYYETEKGFNIEEHGFVHEIDWYNAITFGNGVESNRIRDDFNAVFIDNGVRASAPLAVQFKEEHKFNGLIWSGIINSRSGTNQSNQFNVANPITKDLLPSYGSIQKLFSRDNDIVIYCEDKILKALADKDILYNADGSSNLVASNRVIGNVVPFAGEYGISRVPESFAFHGFRAYNADPKRGVILRLSMDGLTVISANNMSGFFRDRLYNNNITVGTYDNRNKMYNLSFDGLDTVCFSEAVNGWITRKSFIPEFGISLNNSFYSYNNGDLWLHDSLNSLRNNFYEEQYNSTLDFIINDTPSVIKKFKTLGYEGTTGWKASKITTDQVTGKQAEFIAKENKYFSNITQDVKTLDTLDQKNFSTQGIGRSVRKTNETDYGVQLGAVSNTSSTFVLNTNSDLYTAQSVTKTQQPGERIITIVWRIFSKKDYTINKKDFIGNNIVFEQAANNEVIATLTIDMLQPSVDKTFNYSISGKATKKPIVQNGAYSIVGDNYDFTGNKTGTYTVQGNNGVERIINERTITVKQGYFLENKNFLVNNSLITLELNKISSSVYKIIEKVYIPSSATTISYEVSITPSVIIVLDKKIFSKSLDTSALNNIKSQRNLVVRGEKNAEVNVIFSDTSNVLTNVDIKFDDTGQKELILDFPAGNTSETYTVTFKYLTGSEFDTSFGVETLTISRPAKTRKKATLAVLFSSSVQEFFEISDYINASNQKDFSIQLTLPSGTYVIGKQPTNSDVDFSSNQNNASVLFNNIVFGTGSNSNLVTVTGTLNVGDFVADEMYTLDISSLVGLNVTTVFDYDNNSKDGSASGNYTASSTTYSNAGGAGLNIIPSATEYFWTLTPSSNFLFKDTIDADDFELLNASNNSVISTFADNDELLLRKVNNNLEIGFKSREFTQPSTGQTFTVRPKNSTTLTEAKPSTNAPYVSLQVMFEAKLDDIDVAVFSVPQIIGLQLNNNPTSASNHKVTTSATNLPHNTNYLFQAVIPVGLLKDYGIIDPNDFSDATKFRYTEDLGATKISQPAAGTYNLFENNSAQQAITNKYSYNATTHELTINILVNLQGDATSCMLYARVEGVLRSDKKYVGTTIVDKYHLISAKTGVDCTYQPGGKNENLKSYSTDDATDNNYPKYWLTDKNITDGSKIYEQVDSNTSKPGVLYGKGLTTQSFIIAGDNSLYDSNNGTLTKNKVCDIVTTNKSGIVDNPVNLMHRNNSYKNLEGYQFFQIYKDVTVNSMVLKSKIYKDQKVNVSMEWNVKDLSDTYAPYFNDAPFGSNVLNYIDLSNPFTSHSLTNYNYVKNQLLTETGIDSPFVAGGNIKHTKFEYTGQETPVVVTNPTSSTSGKLTQVIYFNKDGYGEVMFGLYRGARGYAVDITIPNVYPENYYTQYDKYKGYGYSDAEAHKLALGWGSSGSSFKNWQNTIPTFELYVPAKYRPIPSISSGTNLSRYGRSLGLEDQFYKFNGNNYVFANPLLGNYNNNDKIKVEFLVGPDAGKLGLTTAKNTHYDANIDWPFNSQRSSTSYVAGTKNNSLVQIIMGGGGLTTSQGSWLFIEDTLTDINIKRTELNNGDGIATEVTNYWKPATN